MQDNGVETGLNATLHEPISADDTPESGKTYTVPARCGRPPSYRNPGKVVTRVLWINTSPTF
nr:hypothetical protein [Paraburkholderia hospita]